MSKTVKYGVISTARIAVNKHIPAIQDSTNGEVVAISSRDLALAKSEADRLGIPKYYGSYNELIEDPDIDAVVNPLPNTMHHEWTIRAANAGKHVMCEKPIAMTVQEAHEMHDAAEANGVQLAESFTHRLTEQMRYVRDSVANGLIGEVTEAHGRLGSYLHEVDTNIRANPELGGGSLWDRGSYPVCALRFVLGAEPESALRDAARFSRQGHRLHAGGDSPLPGQRGWDGVEQHGAGNDQPVLRDRFTGHDDREPHVRRGCARNNGGRWQDRGDPIQRSQPVCRPLRAVLGHDTERNAAGIRSRRLCSEHRSH